MRRRAARSPRRRYRSPAPPPPRFTIAKRTPHGHSRCPRNEHCQGGQAPAPDDSRKPDSPTDVSKPSWQYIAKKTLREFTKDQCPDLAAALTYYAVLSLFPALMALVSLLGIFGDAEKTTAALLSGPAAEAVGGAIGLSGAFLTVWNIAKWPVIVALVIAIIAVLYYATPNIKQPKFKWMSIGSLIALVVSILASLGFAYYVANFGNYNKTYGALGGVIIMLLWLWILNMSLPFGAEYDAEMERGRQLQAGIEAEETIQLPPRDTKRSERLREQEEEDIRRGRELRERHGKGIRRG
jgi:uncharacterized BrkB/YihY/UPF0761 family membrane protein